MSNSMSRRNFLALGGLTTVAAASASFTGCAPNSNKTDSAQQQEQAGYSFLQKPEPITDFKEEHDYDVVVVGAGVSGMAATIAALKGGAKVAVIQKESKPVSQGNSCSGVDVANASENAI